jgi:hypothetical protein
VFWVPRARHLLHCHHPGKEGTRVSHQITCVKCEASVFPNCHHCRQVAQDSPPQPIYNPATLERLEPSGPSWHAGCFRCRVGDDCDRDLRLHAGSLVCSRHNTLFDLPETPEDSEADISGFLEELADLSTTLPAPETPVVPSLDKMLSSLPVIGPEGLVEEKHESLSVLLSDALSLLESSERPSLEADPLERPLGSYSLTRRFPLLH